MDDPIRLLLTNAAAAGLIALLAWTASRTVRRPAVVHGLWLLALARLVMPPIAPLPLVPAWPGLVLTSSPPSPTVVSIPPADGSWSPAEASSPAPSTAGREAAMARVTLLPAPATRPVVPPPTTRSRLGWRAAAWLSLAAGALAIALLTAWRFARFGRLLGCAQPASDAVTERTSRLATRLGLRRVPLVLLVPARIPPMLWPHRGGPRLLLPAGLLPDLHGDELDALLAHELAHVRRRDHWVRLVEIAATALFWWYPVTWWARRALRRAEERCCDEWVLRLLPHSAGAYANGLLKSLSFVAHRTATLPSLASGAGPVEDIEARLKEILMTRPIPRLPAPMRLSLAAAAALGLAVFPTHAQTSATKDEPAPPAAVAATAAVPAPPPAAPVARPAVAPRPAPRAPVAPADPTPQAQPATAPEPAIAARDRASDPARRALEEQRRAIEDQRRQLRQQELELARKQMELEGQAEQAELRAEAARLQADGKTEEAARIERQVQFHTQRVELQKRQLSLELERAALEEKLDAAMRAHEDRLVGIEEGTRDGAREDARLALERAEKARQLAELELEKKQQAIETEMREAEKQMQVLAVEDQVRAMRDATDEVVRSLAKHIQSLRQAADEAPGQRAAVEHEIQRLQAALDALQSGGTPKAPPRKTPRPQP